MTRRPIAPAAGALPEAYADQPTARGGLNLRTALELLAERAASHLTPAEVEYLSTGADAHAAELSRWCGTVAEGVGCYVADDRHVGYFDSRQAQAELLWLLGAQCNAVAGLLAMRAALAPDPVELPPDVMPLHKAVK